MIYNRLTLVATVLDEYASMPGWLGALRSQTVLPIECIIVDGGSTDGTLESLQSASMPFPVKLISAPGCNISEGRNIGLSHGTGEIFVVTDAGTRADSRWLERLARAFDRDPDVDIVAGFFAPATPDIWSRSLAAATLPDIDEIDPGTFLASSRSVAFRSNWFAACFAYPVWLDYCEDVVFDLQLRRAGAKQQFEPAAVVEFLPRRNLRSFFRQYYRYARGDGKAGLFVRRHLVRYSVYAAFIGILARRRRRELALASIAGAIHMRKPVRRLFRRRHHSHSASKLGIAIVLAASQSAAGDVAKMLGYPVGLWWRYKRDDSVKFWKSGWRHRSPSGALPRI